MFQKLFFSCCCCYCNNCFFIVIVSCFIFWVLARLLQVQVFYSTIGNDLNELKDKAKKANSAYKWIKENWKKIFVIIVAIFALIVVVGIYRRCFSGSG